MQSLKQVVGHISIRIQKLLKPEQGEITYEDYIQLEGKKFPKDCGKSIPIMRIRNLHF